MNLYLSPKVHFLTLWPIYICGEFGNFRGDSGDSDGDSGDFGSGKS